MWSYPWSAVILQFHRVEGKKNPLCICFTNLYHSIAFQYKDEVVAVVSVKGNENALSVVPLVVNAVLENHSFLVDTVIIVHPTTFPRTRFGDKSRRKALTAFAEKKL
jgi:hypothetical protein